MRIIALVVGLLLMLLLSCSQGLHKKRERSQTMTQNDYGKPNPQAPQQLRLFDFLVGKWECEVRIKNQNTGEAALKAIWTGRYILDGFVIADEYRMVDADGNLVMLGMNYRSYDTRSHSWKMKWLDAMNSTWLNLGPEELGGVESAGNSISLKAQYKPNELHRIRFFDISEAHFTWRVDISTDGGKTWNDAVMIIEARRPTV